MSKQRTDFVRDGHNRNRPQRSCIADGCDRPGMVVIDRMADEWMCLQCHREMRNVPSPPVARCCLLSPRARAPQKNRCIHD